MENREERDGSGESGARRVLVVDDSATVRSLVVQWLRGAGYAVVEANDGLEALERYHRQPVEVVITDVGMPRAGGLELLAALRRESVPPEVILLTGTHASDTQAAVQALRLGAHDYIVKDPAAGEALTLAVRGAAEKWRLRQENARLLRELRRQSVTDALTSLGNRRALDEALREELAQLRRTGRELSLVLLDLDHFKRVNDTLGHSGGDAVLVSFARRLRAVARASDRLFRHGGEEFAVLVRETPLDGAAALAQRIVTLTAATPMAAGRRRLTVTCSAGVAPGAVPGTSADALMARADAALYAAKEAGRNRVYVSDLTGGLIPYAETARFEDVKSQAPDAGAWGGTC